MGFEDDYNPSGTVTKVTRNLLGARTSPSPRVIVSRGGGWGVGSTSALRSESAMICYRTGANEGGSWSEASGFTPPPDPLPASGEGENPTHGYPLYDGHGNCRAILTKNGTSYGTGNWRTYDVWGSVRSGSATGDPKSRYVASIGHVADDESSLTYMRARYYEPATGRFLSEDPAMQGTNWFIYCGDEPVQRADRTGRYWVSRDQHNVFGVLMAIGVALGLYAATFAAAKFKPASMVLFALSTFAFACALECTNIAPNALQTLGPGLVPLLPTVFIGIYAMMGESLSVASKNWIGLIAASWVAVTQLMTMGALLLTYDGWEADLTHGL